MGNINDKTLGTADAKIGVDDRNFGHAKLLNSVIL
jgi:hypothetical protein